MGFTMYIRPDVLEQIRKDFPVGCKVEVVSLRDPYRDFRPAPRAGYLPLTTLGPSIASLRITSPWVRSGASIRCAG